MMVFFITQQLAVTECKIISAFPFIIFYSSVEKFVILLINTLRHLERNLKGPILERKQTNKSIAAPDR